MAATLDTTQRASAYTGASTNASDQARLVVIKGEPFAKTFEIKGSLTIGRSSGCDIQFVQKSVSRQHCRIWREGQSYHIQDLGSTNRTMVNRKPIEGQHALSDGDRIAVGQTVLKFVVGDAVEADYHEELYARATEDPLTGIANRRQFEEALVTAAAACSSQQLPLTLAVVDVDNFKDINDNHDHSTGDAVLRELGAVLTAHVRDVDTVARLGGEEFGIIQPGVDVTQATHRAESLRALIASKPLNPEGSEVRITVSIGVAQLAPGEDVRQLFKIADRALFKAKRDGRDRVCVADPTALPDAGNESE